MWCAVWTTADWLEREVYDMFGVRYANHPNLKRILLPEDWVGFPLRKDYNIRLQDVEWVRKHLGIDSGQKYYVGEARARGSGLHHADRINDGGHMATTKSTETLFDASEITVSMGPQHPSTHGVLQVKLKLDGERVIDAECVIGYLHRGVEKLGEAQTYGQCVPDPGPDGLHRGGFELPRLL